MRPTGRERYTVPDTQLKIAPIGEGLSLKARAYEALKAAIMNMNIYADDAELRLDERDHLPFDGALTNRELVPRLTAAPALADPFAALVERFDRLWYGQTTCTADEYAAFAQLGERVWQAAGTVPPARPDRPSAPFNPSAPLGASSGAR